MPEWLGSPWPWLLGVLGLFALAYYVQTRHPDPSPREPHVTLAYCAWCIHRDGDPWTEATEGSALTPTAPSTAALSGSASSPTSSTSSSP